MLTGWVERDGRRLSEADVAEVCRDRPAEILRFGGEFFLRFGKCRARDHFGIMQGDSPKGTLMCGSDLQGSIEPAPMEMPLEEAIITAVRLRSDEGITALSGGVDSALVAHLARRECVTVGLAGSHDLRQARHAASLLGLNLTSVTITPQEIEEAFPAVLRAIPKKDPMNAGIALTLYFVARYAGEQGHRRIITGQGADEIFGGYFRHTRSRTLGADLEQDFAGLEDQAARDQSVAALFGTYLSMPYLDCRVVRAARAIPPEEKVQGELRKIPLRKVAEHHIPLEIALYGKKAMQYGSGVHKELVRLARKKGYKTSVQDYIDQLNRVDHGHRR
jgi:asparagine synthase (glutamine-hydrolysing)